MFGLKDKFGELKENAGTIKNNINKLSIVLANEKASILELQKEIQNSYDLLMEKINVSNKKEEEIKVKQDELNNLREELSQVKKGSIERDIENKTLTQNIKILTKDNKELKEKLYQKEQDELKFKILTNETSINIENLKNKMDKQNEEVQQYKIEIESLKDKIEKQNKTKITSISPDIDPNQKLTVNNINSLEEEIKKNKDQHIKKEQKKYIDLLKESKLDLNNIQEFILNRSKSIDDPEELSTNDWKKVLNFGVGYKILTNREIQQLKQISLMLGNSGYKNERSEILHKVKESGFEISLYKAEDWEKVLDFLVETKGVTKEVKDGFEGIFKKYKKKKIFKLEQLKFILPYFEKYKENIKKVEVENNDDFLEIKEESCLTPFGKALNENYIEKKEKEITLETIMENITESIEEKVEKNATLVESSNKEIEELNAKILVIESDEWQRIKCWLRENKILDCISQKEIGYYNFCDVLRFNKKLTTGQMIKAREIYTILENTGYNFVKATETKKVEQVEELYDKQNEIDENITNLILNKLKRLEDVRIFTKEEWKSILDFGIQYDLFKPKGRLEAERVEGYRRSSGRWNQNLLEMGKRTYKVVEKNGYNASIFDFYEWNKVVNHLKENKIVTTNIVHEFYDISNESEETGFFSLEQLKFISPYLDKFKELKSTIKSTKVNFIDENEIESGKIEYNKFEEFNESKYDLSEIQNRTLRELKLFSSKDWKNLSIWSDNRLLIETEDIEVLEALINGKSLEKFKELELIGLIELYEYLVDEGFNKKDLNLKKEEESSTILKEIKSFNMENWRELYDWSDKKLLIQHEDHKLLAPLVNGNSIGNMEESDLINLSNLYKRLLEKGFEKKSNIPEEKSNQLDEEKLLEEVRSFKYNEWNQMFEWGKKKKKLKNKDLSLLTGLAIRSNNKELSQNELLLGLEVYFILMSEGFELVKEKDVDEFLMQFMDESESVEDVQKEDKTNKIINFNDLINEGLKNGVIQYTMLEKINYDKEIEINDYFEAIEELEDRGIIIKY